MVNWKQIDTVFLDMDGTLLDLHFDNHFWLEHLPYRFAEIRQMSLEHARTEINRKIAREEGKLSWYCLDFWSQALQVDIPSLKEEVSHLIDFRPGAEQFLTFLKQQHRDFALVTNAHRKSIDLKLAKTRLGSYFSEIVCSHDYDAPKETQSFWQTFHAHRPFNPARTMMIDDSLSVLNAARHFGIAHCYSIKLPDSKRPPQFNEIFPMIADFGDLIS